MYRTNVVKKDYSSAIDFLGGFLCIIGCLVLMSPNKFLGGLLILFIGVLIVMRPIKLD